MQEDVACSGKHRAEHVDQADKSAADAGHVAADPFKHAGDGHGLAVGRRRRLHAANLVNEAGIVRREPGDLRLRATLAKAAAQPFDQPGAEGIEPGDLRNIDEDVGPAAAEPLRIGNELLHHGRMAGDPRAGRGKRQPIAPCNPLQCRVAVQTANSGAVVPRGIRRAKRHAAPRLVETVMYQPLLVRASRRAVQNHQTLKWLLAH